MEIVTRTRDTVHSEKRNAMSSNLALSVILAIFTLNTPIDHRYSITHLGYVVGYVALIYLSPTAGVGVEYAVNLIMVFVSFFRFYAGIEEKL